jgi:iduronate 2-sulfatase
MRILTANGIGLMTLEIFNRKLRYMAYLFVLLLVCDAVCFQAGYAATRPNVLFIAIDDLRNELGAFGVAHAISPELDAFAKTARVFDHHYVQVPTCGASRCALMRGSYPTVPAQVGNNGIKQTQKDWSARSLPSVFRKSGYRTLALGKITHYPGGLTGKGWAEGPEELPGAWDRCWIPDGPWKTPEAIMHGYANGVARQPGKSPPWESYEGSDDAYPDAWIAKEAVVTLQELATRKEPWFFGVGFFKPHLPFAAPKKYHDLHANGIPDLLPDTAAKPSWNSGWHRSSEFRGNYGHPARRDPDSDLEYSRQMRRAYAGCVSYVDSQVGKVLAALQEFGLAQNTIVVVWSDHGFLLGEHAIWGKHCLYEQALRSPLLIRYPGLKSPGISCKATVEAVDVFPTLVDLCDLAVPTNLDGRSLRPFLVDPSVAAIKPAHGFWTGGQRTIRTERWRLISHPSKEGVAAHVELFDYLSDPEETRNHADIQPEVVREMLARLKDIPEPDANAIQSEKAKSK